MRYATVLTIAGSDCSGGAGIQADIKAISATGGYACSVITALTAQNTQGVQNAFVVDADFVKDQLTSIQADIEIDAIKVGMISSPKIIKFISEFVQKHWQNKPIVVDPVITAKGGFRLIDKNALLALKEHLIPLATLITPNIPELYELTDNINLESIVGSIQIHLANLSCEAILIKGGHLDGNICTDRLFIKDGQYFEFKNPRIETNHTHGTGCSLSSSIASYLAQGFLLREAVEKAIEYVHIAIKSGSAYQLGEGHGPIHHFFKFKETK